MIMFSKTEVGKYGENIAIKYIHEQGYTLIEKNFHTRYGEIDLITLKSNAVYFFEVKLRNSESFGYGDEAISKSKIEKLRKSIEIWITKNRDKYDCTNVYLNGIVINKDRKIVEYEVF